MHELLEDRPELVRLLRSGQSALPVTENFWEDLAHGIGLRIDELGEGLEALYNSGIVAGIWGEPNPVPIYVREALVQDQASTPEHSFIRWHGKKESGTVTSVVSGDMVSGWKSHRWFKAGTLLDFDRLVPEQLVEKSRDRSMLVKETMNDEQPKGAPEGAESLGRVLAIPKQFLPNKSLWEQIADVSNMEPDSVRQSVGRLILGGEWRRFSLRIVPAAAGWKGCGLAKWRIDDEQVMKAANALAQISATGDVCTRIASDENPYNLSAIFIGHQADDGHLAAQAVAKKWGVELGSWTPLEIVQ